MVLTLANVLTRPVICASQHVRFAHQVDYYESRSTGLGAELEIDAAIETILRHRA
jgi:hypothetical protein